MLIVLAIANAILWSGVILALLLWLMRSHRDIESRLCGLEASSGEDSNE